MTSMKQMNQALHIRLGAMYWMDWKCEANEKARPMQVVVDSVYPHVIIVKDSRGKKIGIPAASAALDLRLTRERPPEPPKAPVPKKVPLDHEEIIKGYLAGKSSQQIAVEMGRSRVSINRVIREWKKGKVEK